MDTVQAALTHRRMTPDLAEFMTTEEAAKKLGFHVISIRRMVREGKLKGVKVGPTWLVSRKSVDEYKQKYGDLDKSDPRRGQ